MLGLRTRQNIRVHLQNLCESGRLLRDLIRRRSTKVTCLPEWLAAAVVLTCKLFTDWNRTYLKGIG